MIQKTQHIHTQESKQRNATEILSALSTKGKMKNQCLCGSLDDMEALWAAGTTTEKHFDHR
jgi:hypothetical protein